MNEKDHKSDRIPPHVLNLLRDESDEERRALMRAWEASGAPLQREPSDEALARMGAQMWSNIEKETRTGDRPPRVRLRRQLTRWPAAVAAFAVLLLAGTFYLTWPSTMTAPLGERLALTLSDGSSVELNSGASFTYAPRIYGWVSRSARLNGEAYFEVVPGRSDFVVRTFNAEVRVLGTSFNVRAWPDRDAGATIVSLHTGQVRLSSRSDEASPVILRPGERSSVFESSRTPTPPETVDIAQTTAWRTGRFVFADEPISVILDEMERRFGVSLTAASDEILKDRLTLSYDRPANAEVILSDIASSYSRYAYRRVPGGYELYVP